MTAELWIRADLPESKADRKELVISALEAGVSAAIVRPEDSDFADLGKLELVFNGEDGLSGNARFVSVSSPEEQASAMALAGTDCTLVVETADWTVIPLENLIAAFRDTPTKVMVCASDPEQAALFSGILEKGVDGVVVQTDDPGAVRRFSDVLAGNGRLELSVLQVTGVKPIEMGDRVCVDTVSMMAPGEGMLVGSQSACLFLVQSESEDNGYVAARPFRVNAGAVHAYVLAQDGRTRYLSELRSGESVLLVDREGNTRRSSVGRCKVERRPLVMVSASLGGREYTTILQNAETVRLVTPDGSVSVSAIGPGDRVLARVEDGGRHFGMKVDETVREI